MIRVEDPTDPRLFDFVSLRDGRSPDGVFIVEGLTPLAELVRSRYPVRAVLVAESKVHRVLALTAGVEAPIYVGDMDLVRATVGFNLHRGIVASATRLPSPDPFSLLARARHVAVLEDLNDVENLGNLFRSARAFGVDAVLLDPRTADPLYRRCVRVSMGHVLHVPFARFETWPDPLAGIRASGFTIAALTPGGDVLVDDVAGERIAWLLGAEGPGLSDAALARADLRVRIPMVAGVDSLNVGTAAAIAFRQGGLGEIGGQYN